MMGPLPVVAVSGATWARALLAPTLALWGVTVAGTGAPRRLSSQPRPRWHLFFGLVAATRVRPRALGTAQEQGPQRPRAGVPCVCAHTRAGVTGREGATPRSSDLGRPARGHYPSTS